MAASSRLDMASGSGDRPVHAPRGSYTAASFERSGSFRENMENPILSALPNMSRSSPVVAQVDVMNFFQCLRFDPKAIAADHKSNRQVEVKRLTSAAIGLPLDDSLSGPSKGKLLSPSSLELKRLKAGIRESSIRARERLKIFTEALSVMNKCFPSIPSRKRSRLDALSTDRSNAVFPGDRSASGSGLSKVGSQSHAMASGFELEPQKLEEKTKNSIPNKRTRTSMADIRIGVRPSTPARPSGNIERTRDATRLPNTGALPGEDRTLLSGIDGCEKSKIKKKRSGIKPDVSLSRVAAQPIEGYRESKQGMQPRLLNDARSRLHDSHALRQGVPNGTIKVGKEDVAPQPSSSGLRSSMPKLEQDSGSLLHARRDRRATSDKERVNLRTVSKNNSGEDYSPVIPTPSTSINSAARAPRSGANVFQKLSPVVQRSNVAHDWELSHCTSKLPSSVGVNNRKRTPSTRSSSPPVAHWAQKISRTARRTNIVPTVPSNDGSPTPDMLPDMAGNEHGPSFPRRLSSSSPQQVKSSSDHFSSAALSESEESGAPDIKSRDKSKKTDEVAEKMVDDVQKVSTPLLPPRKNKLINGDESGDGVRRQGRSGRGFTSTRSLMPVEKLRNTGTAKQLRSAKLGFDKIDSKLGRPPTRKLSDRKPYTRQKHIAVTAADFSDDGHEELLAAAAAVVNSANSFSSPFWRRMEPYFGFLSDTDIAYLKQQENLGSNSLTPTSMGSDSLCPIPNGYGLFDPCKNSNDTNLVDLIPEYLVPASMSKKNPLFERLLAALIPEEGNDELYSGIEGLECDVFGSGFELEMLGSSPLDQRSVGNFKISGHAAINGYRISANRSSVDELDQNILDNDTRSIPEKWSISTAKYSQNGLLSDHAMTRDVAFSEYQYGNMSIDERVLLELQSVGLSPEPVPDLMQTGDEKIGEDISRLEGNYHEQVTQKNILLGKLLNSASRTREFQEKEFEHCALDKLVTIAYEKYMGSNASGSKSASSKMARQTALAFVHRTLERCETFEHTGVSCFGESGFRDMFISSFSKTSDAQPLDAAVAGESAKPYSNSPGCPFEFRDPAPLGTQQSPFNHDNYSSSALLSTNHLSEQNIGEEDPWSTRVKRRELSLDDVGGTSNVPSGIGSPLSNSAKGKRSERDRDGKGNTRDVFSRNGTAKIGRTSSGNNKGERKTKTKPKQKSTQLSASVSGLIGKLPEQPKSTMPSVPVLSERTTGSGLKEKDESSLHLLDDQEALDLSHLQLPEMDILGVPDDLGGQGEDIGSWLNIDDDGLQDHDSFMGLEIPMDDLTDLNFVV